MNCVRAVQRGLISKNNVFIPPNAFSNLLRPTIARTTANFSSKPNTTGDKASNESPSFDHGHYINDERFKDDKPTIAYAKAFPKSFSNMRHEQILQLREEGNAGACKEALVRNIMATDEVEYDDALAVFLKIEVSARDWILVSNLPYKIGLGAAVVGGIVSFPMVFHYDTVKIFHDTYISADVPEPKDTETFLEVGSWSWAWMEPVIGQISFALLTAQFARAQLINLGIAPYGNFMKRRRAQRLIELYPRYDPDFLRTYSYTTRLYNLDK